MRRAGNKPQTPANQCKGELSQTGAAVEPVAAALLFMAFAGITLLLVRRKTNRGL